MKNIKTFKQLFENSMMDKRLKIVSFGADKFDEFISYINSLEGNWRMLSNVSIFKSYTARNGNVYIINDEFVIQYKGETIGDIEVVSGADATNRTVRDLSQISEKIGCSEIVLKIALIITKMTGEFSMDLNNNMGSTEIMDYLCDYFKKNPLMLYTLDGYPELKKEVMDKTGIKDYGSIGRKLKSGLM
jgi:hypothetical protein